MSGRRAKALRRQFIARYQREPEGSQGNPAVTPFGSFHKPSEWRQWKKAWQCKRRDRA